MADKALSLGTKTMEIRVANHLECQVICGGTYGGHQPQSDNDICHLLSEVAVGSFLHLVSLRVDSAPCRPAAQAYVPVRRRSKLELETTKRLFLFIVILVFPLSMSARFSRQKSRAQEQEHRKLFRTRSSV
jgi:hypothetical protein